MTDIYNRIFDRIERTIDSIPTPVMAFFFLAIPVIIFWRPYFFFFADDWTTLMSAANNPFWNYLHAMDAEQWFPLSHLVYYGMIKIAGPNYSIMVFISGILAGITAFLVYQFFQLHLRRPLALIFSLIYAGAAVHTSTIFHPYNVCYILSFGFFMAALLLTDRYLHRPSWLTWGGIGLCGFLALLSHSFAILTVSAVPLYGLILGTRGPRRDFWPLVAVIAGVYLCFFTGYFTFAGLKAATSQNPELFASLPGPAYYLYVFTGWILAPNYHLFPLELFFPALFKSLFGPEFRFFGGFVLGMLFFLATTALIVLKGDHREKRLCLWVFLANLLPFILVGLVRYKISVHQALTLRYGVFTLMGILLLTGIGWRIFIRNFSPRYPWASLLLLPFLALIIVGQAAGISDWQKYYKKGGKVSRACYENLPKGNDLDAKEGKKLFCPENHPWLTKGQALEIRRFLEGR